MIKILHTSDWHLGKIIYGVSLIEDQKYFIEKSFFPILKEEQPDLIVISGDIFDKQIAPIEAIRLFNYTVTRVNKDFKIPIAIISGNHDSKDRMAPISNLLHDEGVHIVCDLYDENRCIEIKKGNEFVRVCLVPYFDLRCAKEYLSINDEISFSKAFRFILDSFVNKFQENEVNILVTHSFVTGSKDFEDARALSLGGVGEVSPEVFQKFDYVALGHIHTHQKVFNKCYYSGAPLKYSFDEPNVPKSVTVVEIFEGKINRRYIEIKPRHTMRTIKGTFSDLISNAKYDSSQDYICAKIMDKYPIYMPMEQLRVYYPNIMMIESNFIHCCEDKKLGNKNETIDEIVNNKELIFKKFLEEICDIEPKESDYKVLREICRKVEEENQ